MDTPQIPEASAAEQAQAQEQHTTSGPSQEATPTTEEAPANYASGYSRDPRGNHSYSNAPIPDYAARDGDNFSRPNSSPSVNYQQQPQLTRPPSAGVSSGHDRPRQPLQPAKNSVVIKVGMVGDAQIGKTSLMVKYVEGSWDEDYIQTLGECGKAQEEYFIDKHHTYWFYRCQFYGKDHLHPEYRNYFLDLGSWWST